MSQIMNFFGIYCFWNVEPCSKVIFSAKLPEKFKNSLDPLSRLFGLKPNNQVFFLIEAKTEKIFFQSMGKKGPVSHAPVSESRSPFGSADLNANYKEVEDCFLCRPEQ